jgi:neutral ceramidase
MIMITFVFLLDITISNIFFKKTTSAPGGIHYTLFLNVASKGFCSSSFNRIVDGIVKSVQMAESSIVSGKIFVNRGKLNNANIK